MAYLRANGEDGLYRDDGELQDAGPERAGHPSTSIATSAARM